MREDGGARLTPKSRPMWVRTGLAGLLALALSGCAGAQAGRTAGADRNDGARALPAAEQLADDLYMVPIARDGRGCVQYRMQSDRRPRLQALFYRTQAGDFSTIEAEAACT